MNNVYETARYLCPEDSVEFLTKYIVFSENTENGIIYGIRVERHGDEPVSDQVCGVTDNFEHATYIADKLASFGVTPVTLIYVIDEISDSFFSLNGRF